MKSHVWKCHSKICHDLNRNILHRVFYMPVTTVNKKEAVNLNESEKGCARRGRENNQIII